VEYNDLISDFADRTLRNLDDVQKRVRHGDKGLYDVTQLWNSLLGLIVLPLETEKKNKHSKSRIPATPMTELGSNGWPRLTVNGGDDESLHDLVKNLRHAVAHANVKFIAGSDHQIASVEVWNEYPRGTVVWNGRATVEELDRFVRLIAVLYRETFAKTAA
jgi:hypothetical protein